MIASKCALFIAVARLGSGVGLPGGGGGSLSSPVSRLPSAASSQPNTPPHPAQLTGEIELTRAI